MKRFTVVATILCFVFVALAIAPMVKANNKDDKKTTMTFSEPFEVPGVDAQILPAGTYIFELVDSRNDRNIVQIFSADGLHIYTTILAIPNYRLKATDKTVLTFKERGENQPEAIKAWFSPGEIGGQEFVYPKKRAIELAKVVKEPVLVMPTIEAAGPVPFETLETAPVAAVDSSGTEVPVASVVEAAPPAEAAAVVAETLPQTASLLPLFTLAGLLSLFVGSTLLIVTTKRIA